MEHDKFADRMLSTGAVPQLSPRSGRPERVGRHPVHGLAKATFDRTVAAVALLLLAPVLLAVALCVKTSGPGPVFARQERVGRHGRLFFLLGFRVTEATGGAGRQVPESDAPGRREPRSSPGTTSVGATLRRYSIDELPQLFNVLRGDMSLVGPRPVSPSAVRGFDVDLHRRFPVKPGLTGLGRWSSGPHRFPDDGWGVDADYVENWSLLLDLGILRKTFAAALRGNGAP